MKSEFLSNRELRIYKHQIDLPSVGISGQEKIKKAKALVIGAGGKGTFVLQNLAAAGLGSIGICDNHIVEETALPRQSLYGHGDLGKQKAIVSRQRIIENNHFTHIDIHNIFLSESNMVSILSNYDIIIDATDNFSTHYAIDKTGQELKKPVVFGTIYNDIILISVFHYKRDCSLWQLYPSDPQHQNITIPSAQISGEIIQYSLAGSLLANEALKIILDMPGILDGKVLKFYMTTYQAIIDTL